MENKILASGDLVQIAHGDRLSSHLRFQFRDGSVDDDRSEFSQHGQFRLISEHHVQKGPTYPRSMDLTINAVTGQVRVVEEEKGKTKVQEEKMDIPADLVNGMFLGALKNTPPDTKELKLSYLAATPKLRLVKLVVRSDGDDTFVAAGWRHKAWRMVVKVELGGVAGVVAPMIGKQPADTTIWFSKGPVPAFVKTEGPLYGDGPVWRIEMISAAWPGTQLAAK